MNTLRISKSWLLFLLIFYYTIFSFSNLYYAAESIVPQISLVDELIAAVAIPLFLFNLFKKSILFFKKRTIYFPLTNGCGRYVFLFFLIGIAGNLIYKYQPFLRAALPDAFLCLKFWLAVYTGQCLFNPFFIKKHAKGIYLNVCIAVWMYLMMLAADVALGGIFESEIRYGFRSTQLFYSHPTCLVACCTFLIALLLSIKKYVKVSRTYYVILCFLMCSTLRSKAFGDVFILISIWYFVFYRKKELNWKSFLIFIPAVLLIAWNQVEYYFYEIKEEAARYQLLEKSFMIAKEHFPIGSGFGTFASHYSAVVYSPLYSEYGLSHIYGLEEGRANFVSDSFWPMILGQTGWLGLSVYCLAIWSLFKQIRLLNKINRGCYASALFIFAYLMVESAAASSFVFPTAVPLAVWLGALFSVQHNKKNRRKGKRMNIPLRRKRSSGLKEAGIPVLKEAQNEAGKTDLPAIEPQC